jgi:hypothetical protein
MAWELPHSADLEEVLGDKENGTMEADQQVVVLKKQLAFEDKSTETTLAEVPQ